MKLRLFLIVLAAATGFLIGKAVHGELPPLPTPLNLGPTAACQCEVCTCPSCDCQPNESEPPTSPVRPDRIDEFSPITLAPDPDLIQLASDRPRITNREADEALQRFRERYKHLKEYSGEKSGAARRLDMATAQPDKTTAARAAPSQRPVTATPPPASRAAPPPPKGYRRVFVGTVCKDGVCYAQYRYEPTWAALRGHRVTEPGVTSPQSQTKAIQPQRVTQPVRRYRLWRR